MWKLILSGKLCIDGHLWCFWVLNLLICCDSREVGFILLQLRGNWCLLILGGFSKTVLIVKLFYIKEICWYSIYKLRFYKCLMCTLTIRFMKNLWDNLNLFKLVCVNISLCFWELWMDYFFEHIEYVLKTYGKLWLKV